MKRPFIVATNWKMNPKPVGAEAAGSPYWSTKHAQVIVLPAYLDLQTCVQAGLTTGAQYARSQASGAYTGDISMAMLKATGVTHVLCGHSERRQYHGETNTDVSDQVAAALNVGLVPIICIGEKADERAQGRTNEVLAAQLAKIEYTEQVMIAYEPVWAIGTGNAATVDQIAEVHGFIRTQVPVDLRKQLVILYGGSVAASNCADLLQEPEVNGVLIGGASLKIDQMHAILTLVEHHRPLV